MLSREWRCCWSSADCRYRDTAVLHCRCRDTAGLHCRYRDTAVLHCRYRDTTVLHSRYRDTAVLHGCRHRDATGLHCRYRDAAGLHQAIDLKESNKGLNQFVDILQWLRYDLTHVGRDKMVDFFQTTFSNAFSWMKMFQLRLKFHWSLFLWVQLTISHHWFR